MQVSKLVEFVRQLRGSLAAVGVPAKALDDLTGVADALAPFDRMDLDAFTDFLKRADQYQTSGAVPATEPRGFAAVRDAAQALGNGITAFTPGTDSADLVTAKDSLKTALKDFGAGFDLTVATTDKNWLAGLQEKAEQTAVVTKLTSLAARIDSPEAAQMPEVQAEIDTVAGISDKRLKAAAQTLGAAATGKGKPLVVAILGKLTGYDLTPPKAKAAKAPKEPKAAPTAEQVAEQIQTLSTMAARAANEALPDDDVNAALDTVEKMKFTKEQMQEIALAVTNVKVKTAKNALLELRGKLTVYKRLVESQMA